ncbi:MAG: extracellular solute-binding protein [Candidatus Eremiobacteraeota bacterium]|nr:extracellular solute-binding protein [Candidatus Eremiobacteraeota bacterium]
MIRRIAVSLIAAFTLAGTSPAPASVSVLYAGSLVTPMENAIKPALLARGITFDGEPGGSKKLANFIRDGIRTPDVFISVDSTLVKNLGARVARATTFANTTLGVAWSDKSRFAAELGATDSARVRYILSLPGIRIGRTDPQLDPKGQYTVEAMNLIGGDALLGDEENPAQVFPEEDLLARIDTGEIDAGFFYKTEAVARGLHFVALPGKAAMSDRIGYTLAVLRNAPHPAAADAFERFILTGRGRTLLIKAGLRYR